MSEDSLSCSMVLKSKKDRIRTIKQPHLYTDVLEKISVSRQKFYLTISELQLLVIWTIN
jgi:hypothetical protein